MGQGPGAVVGLLPALHEVRGCTGTRAGQERDMGVEVMGREKRGQSVGVEERRDGVGWRVDRQGYGRMNVGVMADQLSVAMMVSQALVTCRCSVARCLPPSRSTPGSDLTSCHTRPPCASSPRTLPRTLSLRVLNIPVPAAAAVAAAAAAVRAGAAGSVSAEPSVPAGPGAGGGSLRGTEVAGEGVARAEPRSR